MTISLAHAPDLVSLNLSTLQLTAAQFYELCIANPDRSLELTQAGTLIIRPPVGGDSGNREADLLIDLGIWNRQTQLGKTFSSSTVFKLPLGSQRSPDAAWVELSRWNALSAEDRSKFPPLAPDFIIELRSRNDSLSDLQAKMVEYRDNGARLGLLINPQDRIVEVYRIDAQVEAINFPESFAGSVPEVIDCDDVLPGFTLDLTKIW